MLVPQLFASDVLLNTWFLLHCCGMEMLNQPTLSKAKAEPAHRHTLARASTKLLGDKRDLSLCEPLEQSYGQGHAAQVTHWSFRGACGREGGVCLLCAASNK